MKPRRPRLMAQIDASSTADIAFLLLVFFLVTTTMATDIGIPRKLPPPIDGPEAPVPKRNVLEILVNSQDALMVEGEPMDVADLRARATEHILNPNNLDDYPQLIDITQAVCQQKLAGLEGNQTATAKWEKRLATARVVGPHKESKQVISIKADEATTYKVYVAVQDALSGAYKDAREAFANQYLHKDWESLTSAEKRAVKHAVPQRISEAEPNENTASN